MLLPYNTDSSNVILPEFGRMFENLVAHCMEIEDREERNDCAYAIADSLASMHPALIGPRGEMDKVWDQLMIMSNFKLDVDFPCEVIDSEQFTPKPNPIPYSNANMKFRHYGKQIEKMIDVVADMEDGVEKDNLISMIAHQMKKLQFVHNKEGVEDSKILKDLALYSKGKINLDPEKYFLHEFQEIPEVKTGGRKKRKGK